MEMFDAAPSALTLSLPSRLLCSNVAEKLEEQAATIRALQAELTVLKTAATLENVEELGVGHERHPPKLPKLLIHSCAPPAPHGSTRTDSYTLFGPHF